MRGRTMMLWYLVQKRGGQVKVNIGKAKTVPKDAYISVDVIGDRYVVRSRRRSKDLGKDPLEGGKTPAAGSA